MQSSYCTTCISRAGCSWSTSTIADAPFLENSSLGSAMVTRTDARHDGAKKDNDKEVTYICKMKRGRCCSGVAEVPVADGAVRRDVKQRGGNELQLRGITRVWFVSVVVRTWRWRALT